MDLINLEKKFASIELRLSEIESKLSKAKEQLIADSEVLASPKVDSHLIQSPVSSSNEVIEKKPGNWLGIVSVICFSWRVYY